MHGSPDDDRPLGTAVVIDRSRLLTAAHVVMSRAAVWVAFPMNPLDMTFQRIRAKEVRVAEFARADLAVIDLGVPVPAGVEPARLRQPAPDDLVGKAWWAHGFRDEVGNVAEGVIRSPLAYGWVRLDTESRYVVEPGFSGGGLWCPDYEAVVAVVGEANDKGDGRAITLNHANGFLPAEKIHLLTSWTVDDADEIARASWGWALAADQEASRHWVPRARGVTVVAERGDRFRGRHTALEEIVAWLDRPHPDRKVLVVTGSPGVGKSAVLGRVVVTADPAGVADTGAGAPRARTGSVACAVHAKGKTALDVAREIARAASAPLPDQAKDLPTALHTALTKQDRGRFNLVIDALDEASDPQQARRIVRDLVIPVAAACGALDAQIVVGTRRNDDAGDLIGEFGPAATTIDLDDKRYFSVDDLAAYAQATLQLLGDERPDNPYQSDKVAAPVAQRIAALARQNFLIAGLVARTHGLYDHTPVQPGQISFTPSVEAAVDDFLERLPNVGDMPARDLLLALAYIHAPGVDARLWQVAAQALTRHNPSPARLRNFARTSAANFLVETSRLRDDPHFRLFHQALNDALVEHRRHTATAVADQAALSSAFLAYGRGLGWDSAPTYLFRSLPNHAHQAGLIDTLLTDVSYVLHADLRRLIPPAADATTPEGQRTAQLLRRTPQTIDATPAQRLAMLTIAEALDTTDTTYRDHPAPAPYRARWAHTTPRTELATLIGHTHQVVGVCAVRVGTRHLLASTSADGTVRIWDPETGTELRRLEGHNGTVRGVCAIQVGTRQLLASTSVDKTVRIWDLETGVELHRLTEWVNGVCATKIGERQLLATADNDRTVTIWDPETGAELRRLTGHTGRVNEVCAIPTGERELLATVSNDETVRIWDPETGVELRRLEGHTGWVNGVCAIEAGERRLLATASADDTVRIWDPETGVELRRLEGHTDWVNSICAVRAGERQLLASTSVDKTVRIWDPETGVELHRLTGHTDWVNSICTVEIGQRQLLATASNDHSLRLWNPHANTSSPPPTEQALAVTAVCLVRLGERQLLATASADSTVRIWDLETGTELHRLKRHTDLVNGLCAVRVGQRELLATASSDETVRIWDLETGTQLHRLDGHTDRVNTICAIKIGERQLLATASNDETVRIWNPETGTQLHRIDADIDLDSMCAVRVGERELLVTNDHIARIWNPKPEFEPHFFSDHNRYVYEVRAVRIGERELLATTGYGGTVRILDPKSGTELHRVDHVRVNGVCAVRVGERDLLAITTDDRTVQIWDLRTKRTLVRIPTHAMPTCITSVDNLLAIGMESGPLIIEIQDI